MPIVEAGVVVDVAFQPPAARSDVHSQDCPGIAEHVARSRNHPERAAEVA